MSSERTPRDGKPYYCKDCGMGFDEYLACELPDCELESVESAELRQLFVEGGDDATD